MEAHDAEFGPVDIAVIGYPADAPMTGEAIPLLLDLVDRGIIRVLDVMFVIEERGRVVLGLRCTGSQQQGRGRLRGVRGRLLGHAQ